MPPELLGLAFLASAFYGAYRIVRNVGGYAITQIRTPPPRQITNLRTTRRGPRPISAATRRAAREMQLALMQVRDAPDFRRAASFITQAREVPLAFRQRQYQRFRSLLVEHLANLLDHGVSIETVMPGLTQVITGLGVAAFEGDYIRGEAESRLSQQTTQVPDFAQRLREAQNAYRTRMRTLEAMNELDEDSREQLLEQEKLKFQAQLRAISGEGDES